MLQREERENGLSALVKSVIYDHERVRLHHHDEDYRSCPSYEPIRCPGILEAYKPYGNLRCGRSCMFCDVLVHAVDRAGDYAKATGREWREVFAAWEGAREYWYVNYYAEGRFPSPNGEKVFIFDDLEDFTQKVGSQGFRCPACGEVSKSPYECACGWTSSGLLGCLGTGAWCFRSDAMMGQMIFMPIALETPEDAENAMKRRCNGKHPKKKRKRPANCG